MKKMLFAVISAMSIIMIFATCKNPPIFAAIEEEVKLKPASVKGLIRSVVKVGDTLYVSNGGVFEKSFGKQGKWSKVSTAADLCVGLATDGNNLYGVFGSNKGGDSETFNVRMYNRGASKWEPITGIKEVHSAAGTDIVFSVDASTIDRTIYAIKNGSIIHQWSNKGNPVGAAGSYCLLDNGLYTASGSAVSGSPSGLKGICKGAGSSVFAFNDSDLYCYDGSGWTHLAHKVTTPRSITYLPGRQLVLISGKNGYGEIKLASPGTNLNSAAVIAAGSSGSSIPQQNYQQYKSSVGKWYLDPIAAFDNGSSGYIIYVGANDPNTKYSGLWGFYYPERIEWNRE